MQTIELCNNQLRVQLMDFGARIIAVRLCGQSIHGAWQGAESPNLVQGYQDLNDYWNDESGMGASMGPITNRISNAKLSLGDQRYRLPNNEGPNCLHSGGEGFDRRLWTLLEQAPDYAVFGLTFNLADIGMRGQLQCQARYQLVGTELQLDYSVLTDSLSYLNLTNHVYLNLSGTQQRISDHRFNLFADQEVLLNEHCLPTGKTAPLERPIDYQLDRQDLLSQGQITSSQMYGAMDSHFIVQPELSNDWMRMASVTSSATGISVDIYSDAPGFQLYTANHLCGEFAPQSAFCIEPQSIPDAINIPEFDVSTTPANGTYRRKIAWRFSQKKIEHS